MKPSARSPASRRSAPVLAALAAAVLLGTAACRGISDFDDPCARNAAIGEVHLLLTNPDAGIGNWSTLLVGDSVRLSAVAARVEGGATNVWSGGCSLFYGDPIPTAFVWSSGDPAVARVDSTGLVLGVAPGETAVAAHAPAFQARDSTHLWVLR